jgi:hypothetical protein
VRRIAHVIFAVLLAGIALESAARLARPLLTRTTPAYYNRQYLEQLVVPDPVLVWSGRPHASVEIANPTGEKISYRLNALGWRDKEFSPIEMPGNALVLGDSFTFGLGVPYGKRFTELLENGFRGLDVWNLGVMGYAPDQYLKLAERWLPPVPWKFVLVQLSNNDVSDVAQHEWVDRHSVSGIPAALRPPLSHSMVSQWSEAWNAAAYFGLLSHPRLSEAQLESGLERLLFSLRETAKLANERQVPMLVLMASDWGEPAYGKKIAAEYREGVIKLAREQNFGLAEAGPVELLPAPDLHWSVGGHHKVAEILVPAIREILFPARDPGTSKSKPRDTQKPRRIQKKDTGTR